MNSDAYIWDGTCDDCPYDRHACDITSRCFMKEDVEAGDAYKEMDDE